MAFSIKDPEIDKNLRFLASLTGESLTEAVGNAVAERIEKIEHERAQKINVRNKKLDAFVNGIKPIKNSGFDPKKFRDDLWEM